MIFYTYWTLQDIFHYVYFLFYIILNMKINVNIQQQHLTVGNSGSFIL